MSSFTQFGRATCPDGFSSSYKGFVFSNYYSSQTGQFVCVDEEPESLPNDRRSTDDNQGRLYPVEVKCGTLNCPPFTNDREVPCAQCSRLRDGCPFYLLDSGECLPTCPDTHFPDEAKKTCLKCHEECNMCFGTKDSDCVKCRNAISSNGRRCVAQCDEGFFKLSNGSCVPDRGIDRRY